MGLLSKIFGSRSKTPERPSDYYLASKIATIIEANLMMEGLQHLLNPETAIILVDNYDIALTQTVNIVKEFQNVRAAVYLKDLESIENFKKVYSNSLLANTVGHMATDTLAIDVLQKLKEQIGE
jgi:hypothetical protein